MNEIQSTLENYEPAPQRAKGAQGCVLLMFAGVAVVLLLTLAAGMSLFYSRPLQISKETTYITEPRTADGKRIDYLAAIQQASRPKNMATDENGYRLILQHLGRPPDIDSAHFAAICKELGLTADAISPDLTYEDQYTFLKAYVSSEEFDEAVLEELPREQEGIPYVLASRLGRPWTLDELPMMSQWLDKNGPALDLVSRAVGKSTFHVPLVRQGTHDTIFSDIVLVEAQRMRTIARGLQARANYRIGVGDIDGAIDDIVACQRLGRHYGHGVWLIDLLVGIAIEGIADSIGIAGSLEHPPTKQQLQRVTQATLPPKADFDQISRFEHFIALDVVQALSHSGEVDLGSHEQLLPGYLTVLGFDWNIVAKRLNEHYDEMLATGDMTIDDRPEWGYFHPLRGPRSQALGDVLANMFVPGLHAAREATRRSTCNHQVKHIALAMLIYEREHGTLPPAYSVDEQGRPLHSWRVHLLPYLGHQTLYDQIRLDEPWDSEHNRQFHGEAVEFYRCPSHQQAAAGQTTYSVVVGPDVPFETSHGKSLTDFGPNSDDMILLVERAEPVCWMDPVRELPQSIAEEGINPQATQFGSPPGSRGIASHHPGGANVGLRNGAARFLSETLDLQHFREMLQGTYEEQAY